MSNSARTSIASNVVALFALWLAWRGVPSTLLFPYEIHKLLHIVGVVIFGGNLIVGPIWFGLAFLGKDRAHLAFAARSLALADIVLTVPGLQLTVWNGLFLASTFGGVRAQPWLAESMILLIVTSLFAGVVLYWQERLVDAASDPAHAGLTKAMVWWSICGTAIGLPLALVLYLMVTKHALLPGGP